MKSILLFLSLVVAQSEMQAQQIQWQNTIGASNTEVPNSVIQTSDGGYLIGGFSASPSNGDKTAGSFGVYDYWIVKLDSTGFIEWDRTIGGDDQDILVSAFQTPDDGYVLAGHSTSTNTVGDKTENSMGGWDYWVVKINSSGQVLWDQTLGGSFDERLGNAILTADGGILLGGYSFSGSGGDKIEANMGLSDFWIVKLDSLGNHLWQNSIGGNQNDVCLEVRETADGGYAAFGHSDSDSSFDKSQNNRGDFDYWMVKLDNNWQVQWERTIGGLQRDQGRGMDITDDGGFIISGESNSSAFWEKTESPIGSYDYWILKLDSAGNTVWQNTIGGTGADICYDIKSISDGYLVGGWSASDISGDKTENRRGSSDYWVVKTDTIGSILWQKTIGGDDVEYFYELNSTTDNGVVMAGSSYSGLSGDKTEINMGMGILGQDYWVVKLGPVFTGIQDLYGSESSQLKIYPNPTTGLLQLNGHAGDLKITNLFGQEFLSTKLHQGNTVLDVSHLSSGMYLVTLYSEGTFINEKLIIR
jgi:hypothetical protein